MTWPNNQTRRLHIDQREFLWHLNGNRIERDVRITVGTRQGRFFLFIDPYAHDFEITPANIRRAVQWALRAGWSPDRGPTRSLAYSMEKQEFFWLAEACKFAYQMERNHPAD